MRERAGEYHRAVCDARLDIPLEVLPQVRLEAAGGQPIVRVLFVNNKEIHRCVIDRGDDQGPTTR